MSAFRPSRKPDPRPKEWDNAVRAAAVRLMGGTNEEAGMAGMVNERTVRRWQKMDWWPLACAEASRRWLDSAVEKARVTLLKGLEGDANLALKVLERVDPNLAPPAVVYRRERDFWKSLDALSPEELLRIEEMTDEEAIEFIHSRGFKPSPR